MPRLNGTQTLSKLKDDKRFKDIPVIIYSTSINPLEKEKCMSLGAQAYITKPISFNESKNTIQLFLQYCIPNTPV
jgi:CheY-like chemotaxis protein